MATYKNIFAAIKKASPEELEAFVKEHPEQLNEKSGILTLKASPLSYAIKADKFDNAMKLIALGVNPNQKDSLGYSPLYDATCIEDSTACRQIVTALTALKDIDLDESSFPPLLKAVKRNKLDVVQILLDAGANIDIQGEDGWTALHYAADKGHTELYRYLLEQGADRSIASDGKNVSLKFAANKDIREYYKTIKALPQARSEPQSLETANNTLNDEFVRDGEYIVSITRIANNAGITKTTLYDFADETVTTITEKNKTQSSFVESFERAASQKQLEAAKVFMNGDTVKKETKPQPIV